MELGLIDITATIADRMEDAQIAHDSILCKFFGVSFLLAICSVSLAGCGLSEIDESKTVIDFWAIGSEGEQVQHIGARI